MTKPDQSEAAQGETVIDSAEFAAVYDRWKQSLRSTINVGESWALVGIKRRGAALAHRLWEELRTEFLELAFGEVDISLYRDDYHLQLSQPQVLGTEIEFEVDGTRIILVDDVLYTGRTIRAALNVLLDFGRPRRVMLAVFVDRGHRELPIRADLAGLELETISEDRVRVRLEEIDGCDEVRLIAGSAEQP